MYCTFIYKSVCIYAYTCTVYTPRERQIFLGIVNPRYSHDLIQWTRSCVLLYIVDVCVHMCRESWAICPYIFICLLLSTALMLNSKVELAHVMPFKWHCIQTLLFPFEILRWHFSIQFFSDNGSYVMQDYALFSSSIRNELDLDIYIHDDKILYYYHKSLHQTCYSLAVFDRHYQFKKSFSEWMDQTEKRKQQMR